MQLFMMVILSCPVAQGVTLHTAYELASVSLKRVF